MKYLIIFLTLFSISAIAALPPTLSKGSGEASYSTTFRTNYGTIPVTRSGTTITLGTIPLATTVTTIPALSGEVSNTGNAVTLDNSSVLGKVLTGFASAAGTISSTDTILQAIQKLDGNDALDKTVSTKSQSGAAVSTSQIQTPYNQLTTTAAGERLIETGNANVLADPGAEASTTPWSAYKDAAGVLPVDGTAGTALYVTCANSATAPLAGTKSFLITKTANNAQGEGCSIPFTIPTSSTYKVNRLSFDYAIASGTYTDDQVEWFVYDVTNATVKPFTPSKLKNHSLPSETFAPNGEFQASGSTSYRLIAHVAGTSASAYSLKFDNFKLGVFEKTYGRGDTEYSAQVSNAGVVSGENRDFISGNCAVTSTNKFTCTYVGGLVTQSMNCQVKEQAVPQTGFFSTLVDNTASTSAQLVYSTYTGTSAPLTAEARAVNVFCQKSGTDYANASGLVMSNDADTRVVATRVHGATGTFGTSESTVIYPSVSYDSTGSYNTTTGEYTVKVSGKYRITNFLLGPSMATPLGSGSQGIVYKNGVLASYTSLAYSPAAATFRNTINGSAQIDCIAGDVLLIKFIFPVSAAIDQTGASLNWTTFERISGPSQIAASESVSALYTGAPPTGTLTTAFNTTTFGTKVKDSHSAYTSGSYTVRTSGAYDISAQVAITGTYALNNLSAIAIFVDGVSKYQGEIYAGGAISVALPSINVRSITLLEGQVITIRSYSSATSPVFSSNAVHNFFSITRTGNY